MTSFEPVIEGLRVEAFRGFRDPREFNLSAAAVVVTGPNGTGKTSFFDALQWGLLGSLERLESLRSRRNVEHIVNQYRLSRKALVEIDLRLPSGPMTLRRTGDQAGSTLEIRHAGGQSLFGDEAESELRSVLLPRADLTLDSALTTSGLMQQDVMRRVLEARPADRYRQLSTVLGLGALEDFEDATKSVAKQAVDREKDADIARARLSDGLRQARDRLGAAQMRLATRPQVAALREEAAGILSAAPLGVVFFGGAPDTRLEKSEETRFVAAALGEAIDRVEAVRIFAKRSIDLHSDLAASPSVGQVSALRAAHEAAQVALREAEVARDVAQGELNAARLTAADVAKLAAVVVPMLSEECPVCGQQIDPAHVERELRERAEGTESMLVLEQKFRDLHNVFSRAADAAKSAQRSLEEAEHRLERAAAARDAEITAVAAIQTLAMDGDIVHLETQDIESFLSSVEPALAYFRRARRAIFDFLEVLDSQSDYGAVERAAAEIRSLEASLASAEEQLSKASLRSGKLKALSEHTLQARVEVTEARLRSIQPLVSNIYKRLDPHPAFKTVEFELDTYYRKGTTSPLVIDQVEEVSADPLLIFSTSQANIVALSYFIAMSLSAGDRGLPFLLLDDPVQSMDDVNVLGFADLCRHLRHRRQLIVSTHERRFASLLERKLAPRAEGSLMKLIKFTGWDRGGPTVEERTIEPQLLEFPIRMADMAG